ncbi:unnamed protein product [Rotaria magnacalcarata]
MARSNLELDKIIRSMKETTFIGKITAIHLKNRYEDTFAEYQRLPLRLETASIIMKKKDLTNELDNIERDLDFLEKHQKIFIDNSNSHINKD